MLNRTIASVVAVLLVVAACGDDGGRPTVADALEVRIAFASDWPLPALASVEDGTFGDSVGAEIDWIEFGSAPEVVEALLDGDADVAYGVDLASLAIAVNDGADLRAVAVAVAYPDADNCVAQGDLGVSMDNAAQALAGTTVVAPPFSTAQAKMRVMLSYLGVNDHEIVIGEAEDATAVERFFASGSVGLACGRASSLAGMLNDDGTVVVPSEFVGDELGLRTFDLVVVPATFIETNPGSVTAVVRSLLEYADEWGQNPEALNPAIARVSGVRDVSGHLGDDGWFSFPDIETQLGDGFFGSDVDDALVRYTEAFVELGLVDDVTTDFSGVVDASFLETLR